MNNDEGKQGDDGFNIHRTYWDERRLLIEAQREAMMALDRSLLTLSAAAIGLSLVLLRQLAPFSYVILLVLCWLAFGVTIVSTLWSFQTSQGRLEAQREAISAGYVYLTEPEVKTDAEKAQKLRDLVNDSLSRRDGLLKTTKSFNATSIWAFGIGVVLLLSFAFANLSNLETQMAEKAVQRVQEEKGYTGQDIPSQLLPPEPEPAAQPDTGSDSGTTADPGSGADAGTDSVGGENQE